MNNAKPKAGPLSYVGGKSRIARQLIEIFPAHTTYVEPFAGGAQVLFHKEASKVEVVNDLNHDVVTFFRVCQLHHEEFLRCMRFILVSREWFSIFEAQAPETLTDIQRAVRFFYLQKNAFGGLVSKQKYAHSVTGPRPFNPERLEATIEAAHKRLARVQIESLPYEAILKRFDGKSTLFYLDPPYWGRSLYRFNFTAYDFRTLAEYLEAIKGKFVLSLNDVPEIRELFKHFHQYDIEIAYTVQRDPGKRFRELVITNFPVSQEIRERAKISPVQ